MGFELWSVVDVLGGLPGWILCARRTWGGRAERFRPCVAGRCGWRGGGARRATRALPGAPLTQMASSADSKTLPDLVKESKARRAALLAENERRRKAAADAAGAASTAAMDSVNVGVSTVWHNQQQLELEARTLQEQAKRFAKQSGQWLATHQAFHSSLKALGDVENWARSLESDMSFVNSSLEEVERRREMREAEPPKQPHKIEDVLGDAAK